MILGMLFLLGGGQAIAEPACPASTPEQATQIAQQILAGGNLPSVSPSPGAEYRTRRVMADPFLHRSWAWIEDCRHPERPLQIVALPVGAPPTQARNAQASLPQPVRLLTSRAAVSLPTSPSKSLAALAPPLPSPQQAPATATLIRAGDRVHLWSIQASVRLEIETVALEYGHAGQVIHLRRLGQGAGQGAGQGTMLAGVVVGPDSAELLP